ncbi:hypothetical protein VDGD_01081 [Verticillium dahliae]|nr:hypothetical protein VDGD_01081 [Verticillium dahliae]
MASSTPASEALIEGPLDFITVKTTLPARPLPAHASRQPILTPRLMIRPFAESDIHALRVLRTQPEVMRNTAAGRIDLDVAETQAKLALSLPPNDAHTFNCAICLRDSGEFVGCGGCHVMVGEFGWPVLGYMFVKEHWGRGFATEFVTGFLAAWWALPREVCELRVDRGTVRVGEDGLAEEQYTAVTVDDNVASQRILTKTGFVKRRVYSEIDSADPKGEAIVTLLGFTKGRPKELQSLTC